MIEKICRNCQKYPCIKDNPMMSEDKCSYFEDFSFKENLVIKQPITFLISRGEGKKEDDRYFILYADRNNPLHVWMDNDEGNMLFPETIMPKGWYLNQKHRIKFSKDLSGRIIGYLNPECYPNIKPDFVEKTVLTVLDQNFIPQITETEKEIIQRKKTEDKGDKNEGKQSKIPQDVIELLKNPDLFWIINKEFDKKIVGEKETRQTIFLCMCGKNVENCKLTSYNLMVNSESGAGKDWIINYVLKVFPKEDYEKRTRITENVFTYWHNPKHEPDWTWDGKIFYNEDISNNILNSDVFKTFSSSGSHTTVLIKQTPVDIEIRGKPVMIITTATANPKKEIMRRFTNIQLDETTEQTKAIMKYQRECAKKGITPEYDKRITEALKYLKRVKVKIPYVDILENVFFGEDINIIMRTAQDRFIDYIKASAGLYQYQREKDDEGFLLATGQDYDISRIALLKTMSNPQMIPLTKDQKRILNIFKDKLGKGGVEELSITGFYSVSEIEKYVTFLGDKWLRKQLDNLAEYGFLKKDRENREESKKPVMVYKYVDFEISNIPTYQELQKSYNSYNHTINTNNTINTNDNGKKGTIVSNISIVQGTNNIKSGKNDNKLLRQQEKEGLL